MRRRARRRYLAVTHQRWLAAGAPQRFGRPSQTVVTLLWLVLPAVVAALGATLIWLLGQPPALSLPAQPDARVLGLLLLAPVLAVVLLRRR